MLGAWLVAVGAAAGPDRVWVGRFDRDGLEGWQEKRFEGLTRYRLLDLGGERVLRARAVDAASALYRRLRVDLTATPVLRWRWRIEDTLGPIDETRRGGDDYPARVYVLFSGGLAFWRTRAINYVWSSRRPAGATWPNAYTEQARMVAVRSGPGRAGRWIAERRDVRADHRRLFGEDVTAADGIALMTDTDDTGSRATAYYADLHFTAD